MRNVEHYCKKLIFWTISAKKKKEESHINFFNILLYIILIMLFIDIAMKNYILLVVEAKKFANFIYYIQLDTGRVNYFCLQ